MEKNDRFVYLDNIDFDAHLFHEGTFYKSYEFLGAHPITLNGQNFVRFVVWAPNAKELYLFGDFNEWHETSLPLHKVEGTGLWNICVKDVEQFDAYKYRIATHDNEIRIKADPYAFHAEERPKSASKYFDIKNFKWSDQAWIDKKKEKSSQAKPMSVYEVNFLSWKMNEDGSHYSYRQLADELIPYVVKMGYTHLEVMPIMEHPFDGSWGYQQTGYFAPTSRYGTPEDFMYFVNECHKKGLGVILDWVPVHFCKDDHGLARFDGSHLFESEDYVKRENTQWGTLNFDYSKPEVLSFLISNAIYWHDYFHIDGLRIDAVAYILYLDFTGNDLKNKYGGRENLEAVEFLKKLNDVVFTMYPDTLMMAEESTAWPKVTGDVSDGGLGFNYKWNMGWMNDILEYMKTDPIFRKGNQHALTFPLTYAFSENYILPLSHDEVVHGKKSLLDKMPGTYEEKFANLRLLYLYMYAHPGKKLLFMGGEFAQFIEWDEWSGLDWNLLDYDLHLRMQTFVRELNQFYKQESCLFEIDNSFDGFDWVEHTNSDESILIFERMNHNNERLICAFNFTPVVRNSYPIGVKEEGKYKILLNSDHKRFGGETPRIKTYSSKATARNKRKFSIDVDLPPLGGVFIKLIK